MVAPLVIRVWRLSSARSGCCSRGLLLAKSPGAFLRFPGKRQRSRSHSEFETDDRPPQLDSHAGRRQDEIRVQIPGEQRFTWTDVDHKVKWESALQLWHNARRTLPMPDLICKALRQLKLDGQSQKDSVETVLNAALGGVWHEACVHAISVLAVEKLFRTLSTLCIIALFGQLRGARLRFRPPLLMLLRVLSCMVCFLLKGRLSNNEPASVSRPGVRTDGSATLVVWLPLPGLKPSVYGSEFLAAVTALEECKPKRLVSDCKGVVSRLHALRAGRRQPTGRHRDLESRALAALPAGVHIVWMKAHQSDKDADESIWSVLICKGAVWPMLRPTTSIRLRFRPLLLELGRINMWLSIRPTPFGVTVRDMWDCIRAESFGEAAGAPAGRGGSSPRAGIG
eukprot:6486845-Amphidinium_carterae.3